MFQKKPATPPPPPPTLAAIQRKHQQMAEQELIRAAKAGRLEAETRHATLGTGHAVLALLTYMQMRDGHAVPGTLEAAEGAEPPAEVLP